MKTSFYLIRTLCRYEDAVLGMEAIMKAGFLKAIDVTELEGYPKLI